MTRTLDVDRVQAPAFALADEHAPFVSNWHAHVHHQLLYSAAGTLRLEVQGKQWLLPPQRAAWIPSRVSHRVSTTQPTSLRTLYLGAELVQELRVFPGSDTVVFPVSSLLRELILYVMRWPATRAAGDPSAARCFAVCVELCAELARTPLPLWLPTGESAEVQRAIVHTLGRLDERLRQAEVAAAAGLSERSLARRFPAETQMTWQQFLQSARLLRAAELLSAPGARVTSTAYAVGFESLAAFTRAFERLTGEAPKDYRRRMQAIQNESATSSARPSPEPGRRRRTRS